MSAVKCKICLTLIFNRTIELLGSKDEKISLQNENIC